MMFSSELGLPSLKSQPLAGEAVLADFWQQFGSLYPTHPIVLELESGALKASEVVPLLMHGDGGRHYRKTEILVAQWQPMIGSGTKQSSRATSSSSKRKLSEAEQIFEADCNLLGHSFSTRFLIGTMLRKYYKDSPDLLLKFMGHISECFRDLYETGFQYRGVQLKFILLGCKGDLPYLSKVASMHRSFLHTRKRKASKKSKDLDGICWLCLAGRHTASEKVLFEDFSPEAAWIDTQGINNEKPWTVEPTILNGVLHDALQRPAFFKLDLFHVLNAGIYKDFVASSLVLLLPLMSKTSNEKNMDEMNRVLSLYLRDKRVVLHCRNLSLSLIGADTPQKFPVGGWSKGQDSVVLMQFLPYLMETISPDSLQEKPYKYVYAGACAMNDCMKILYSDTIWMDRARALMAAECGYKFLAAYSRLASSALEDGRRMMFNLVPKLHYWHHIVHELMSIAQGPAGPRPLNPVVHSTAQDEDFIGRISRISRRVKPTWVHRNVLRRYRAALASKLGLLE